MSESSRFYQELPGFTNFEELARDEVFHSVPSDWFVVISDIEGSTVAISEGRYRDVNMLGAASVAVVQAIFGSEPFPFIFGGDGATFLIPPGKIDQVKAALAGLKSFAITQFELGLRVGVMPVSQIIRAGKTVELAKFEIAHGKCTAFIRGGGVTWAESQIKNPKLSLCLKPTIADHGATDALSGLSCRWQPLESQKGIMLSILVQPRSRGTAEANALLGEVLARFGEILGGSTSHASPVAQSNMKYKGFWSALLSEIAMNRNKFSKAFAHRVFELFICAWSFKWKLKDLWPATAYRADIPSHSDYRKFDDMLRLVLDCTPDQVARIESYLEDLRQKGEIFYGTHRSRHALMTCFVENIRPGGHIHFIDGAGGGYTLAAKQLKQQIMLSRREPVGTRYPLQKLRAV